MFVSDMRIESWTQNGSRSKVQMWFENDESGSGDTCDNHESLGGTLHLTSSLWRPLNIFFRLVKHLLWKLNQTQPTKTYLDVSVSIRGLRQKQMKLILLPVLATDKDRESDRGTRWIKEAVHIRKEGRSSMNRDEGSYTLSHTYDRFLATSHHYRGKNRKKN